MIWKRNRKPRPKDIRHSTEAAAEQLRAQQPHVNAITAYLERRKNQNGFGDDFEYTLRPKEAR